MLLILSVDFEAIRGKFQASADRGKVCAVQTIGFWLTPTVF